MGTKRKAPRNTDEYIAGFPKDVQVILRRIRATIRKAAPEALETISYQMAGFRLQGNLIHFAAYRTHIGLYPAPSGSASFNRELAKYRSSKSTIRFPLDKPMPYGLIARIVRLRVKENMAKAAAREKVPPVTRPSAGRAGRGS